MKQREVCTREYCDISSGCPDVTYCPDGAITCNNSEKISSKMIVCPNGATSCEESEKTEICNLPYSACPADKKKIDGTCREDGKRIKIGTPIGVEQGIIEASDATCKPMYEGNTGSYILTLKAPRKTSSGSSIFKGNNIASYLGASASGLFVKYLVNPVFEVINGKELGFLVTTETANDRDPTFVPCEAGDNTEHKDGFLDNLGGMGVHRGCAKMRGGGWKAEPCARGDDRCYHIGEGVMSFDKKFTKTPQFLACDDLNGAINRKCVFLTETNNFGSYCNGATDEYNNIVTNTTCVKLCESENVSSDACATFTRTSSGDNLAFDPTFGDECTAGSDGCYRTCDGLDDGQMHLCRMMNDNGGYAKRFYLKLINSDYYQFVLKIALTLMFSFYGLYSLMGFTTMNHAELINKAAKIGFIYLMVGTTGWYYYDRFIISLFNKGMTQIMYSVADAFTPMGEYQTALRTGNFNDKSVLFSSLDRNLMIILSKEVTYKVMGLLFVSFFGWLYVYIIYGGIIAYIFTSISIIVDFIMAQLIISILLGLGPIFFVLLAFNKTKEMFSKWLATMVGHSFECILFITVLSIFNTLMYMVIKASLNYSVCWRSVLVMNLPIFGQVRLFNFWRATTGDVKSAGKSIPGLFRILLLYIIPDLMDRFITMTSSWGQSWSGGSGTSLAGVSGGLANGINTFIRGGATAIQTAIVGDDKNEGLVGKAALALGKRTIGYKTDKEEDAINEKKKSIRGKLSFAQDEGKAEMKEFEAAHQKDYARLEALQNGHKKNNLSAEEVKEMKALKKSLADGKEAAYKRGFDRALNSDECKGLAEDIAKLEAMEADEDWESLSEEDKANRKGVAAEGLMDRSTSEFVSVIGNRGGLLAGAAQKAFNFGVDGRSGREVARDEGKVRSGATVALWKSDAQRDDDNKWKDIDEQIAKDEKARKENCEKGGKEAYRPLSNEQHQEKREEIMKELKTGKFKDAALQEKFNKKKEEGDGIDNSFTKRDKEWVDGKLAKEKEERARSGKPMSEDEEKKREAELKTERKGSFFRLSAVGHNKDGSVRTNAQRIGGVFRRFFRNIAGKDKPKDESGG